MNHTLFISVLLFFASCSTEVYDEKNIGQYKQPSVITLERDFWDNYNEASIQKNLQILRLNKSDSLAVELFNAGTVTSFWIVDKDTSVFRRTGTGTMDQNKPLINLTGIPDGSYSLGMVSCHTSGDMFFEIKSVYPE